MNLDYYIGTKILFGEGKLNEIGNIDLPGKKALIVITSGTSMKKFGYLDRLKSLLEKNNCEYVVFDKILQNPIIEHVAEGANLAREKNCDFIIGMGGGSSIDSAKAISLMATNNGEFWEYVKGRKIENDPLKVIAITTTAGTGTEADGIAVISNSKTNEKIGIKNEKLFPHIAIVDPELMLTVPKRLTAFQGFDALFHSTEGYLAKCASDISDMYALKVIELIFKYLPIAYEDGNNIKAREKVAIANTLSGFMLSISSSISSHGIEHALSAFYPKLEHGAGLLMISDAFYKFYNTIAPNRMKDMARAAGVDVSSMSDVEGGEAFIKALNDLREKCNVNDLKMSDYGIKKEESRMFAEKAMSSMTRVFAQDRRPLTEDEVVKIIEDSYK
ncbi:iron-containing alcohol dehydrogenase [Eubacterium multiforme]|uniref:Alcohol dehydrogenase n=1 Tax=Eubacterium multiforme TaxID=83339 RepID=A0ABT9UQQ5_9FIRM|nr:iron-containing alcohol dehydrogenase [Eubacterium multiforme]MDQ0148985.1 alcohol dehydrogenase [Eubacterium multiforme]